MKTDTENDLLSGAIAPALVKFALPFLFAYFLQSLYGAVDLLVVGKFADSASQSAVSGGSQIMQLTMALVNGIAMGGTVLIGRKIGEKDTPGVCLGVGNLSTLFVILAAIFTPIMFLSINGLITIMQIPAEAVAHCHDYLFICCMGLPFIVGYNAVAAIYRGIGDSKTPVYFIILATIVNVVLDLVLTGGLGMGAKGAAIATITAQGASFLGSLLYMKFKGFPYKITFSDFKMDHDSVTNILKVGVPLAMQDVLVHFSFMAITAITNTLGVLVSAGIGVAEKIMSFAFLIPSAFAAAVATFASQNLGAGNRKRAIKGTLLGVAISAVVGVLVCLLCNLIPEVMVGWFSNDPGVISQGAMYIKTYSIDCILTAFVFNVNSYLNANRKSMLCFAHSMCATFLVRLPGTYLLKRISGGSVLMIGLAAPAASILSIIICVVYLFINRKEMLGVSGDGSL